jgi:hypothetical protein
MRRTVGPLSLAWLVAAGAAGGCSFFDEVGGGNLSFDLPLVRDFKIDSTDSRWWPCPSLGVPDVVCSGPAALVSDCCQPPAPMPAIDCQEYPLSCDQEDNQRCALVFDYDDAVEIDLGHDVPALKDRPGRVLAQATLATIHTTVTSGVGTLPLRAASLYAAPQSTTSARAAGATFLADVPLGGGERQVDLGARARIGLSPFLTDFNTPFVLILSTHAVVKSGGAPNGVETIKVDGRVEVSF